MKNNITGIHKNQDEEMPKEEKPSVQPSINNELPSKKSIFVAKVKYFRVFKVIFS